jgi:hypothetical protein
MISSVDQHERPAFLNPVASIVDSPQTFGEETDTFEPNAYGVKNLSLSSQLATLRELLRLRSDSPVPFLQMQFPGRTFPLELPRTSTLRHLLDVYFRDMDSFFPYLDQKDTENRISQALKTLEYSEHNHIIDVDVQHYSLIALLCNMLVMGECLDPDERHSEDSRPGWAMFVRGRKLIQHCSSLRTIDLDLVRYHTLSAAYLMHSELLQSAPQAISTAIQLAMVLGLNDQTTWGDCTPEELESRKRLWWTIYYLDRKIGQRSGRAYLIRDNEVALQEFGEQGKQNASLSPDLPWTNDYLQALINLGKLWGQIWDTFFAALAPRRGDWREIDIADTRILLVRRQLPSGLTWNTEMLTIYTADGETEPQIRRRLAIFIVSPLTSSRQANLIIHCNNSQRINLLRMLIRQNPLFPPDSGPDPSSSPSSTKALCALLATHNISAIAAFTSSFPRFRPSGYFITTALVESIYHLVHILQDPSLEADRVSALESFRMAYNLLLEFAQTLNSARRAVRALRSAIFSGGGATSLFEAITMAPGNDERGMDGSQSSGDDRADSEEPEENELTHVRGQKQNQNQYQNQNQQPRPPSITFNQLTASIPTPQISQSSQLLSADSEIQIDIDPTRQESEQQTIRPADHQGFIQDLADCYGDLEFDDTAQVEYGGT